MTRIHGRLFALLLTMFAPVATAASAIAVVGSGAPYYAGDNRGDDAHAHRQNEAATAAVVVSPSDQNCERRRDAGDDDDEYTDLPALGPVSTANVRFLVTTLIAVIGPLFFIFSIYNAGRSFRHERMKARGRIVVKRGRLVRDDAARVTGVDLLIKNSGAMHLSELTIQAGPYNDWDGRRTFGRATVEELGTGEHVVVRLRAPEPLCWAAPVASIVNVKTDALDHLDGRTTRVCSLRAIIRNGSERLVPAGTNTI